MREEGIRFDFDQWIREGMKEGERVNYQKERHRGTVQTSALLPYLSLQIKPRMRRRHALPISTHCGF